MLRPLCLSVTSLAALAAALIAGFFYAYHCSVMPGLDTADPMTAIAAMQAINATVRNMTFAFSFFGTLGFGLLASIAMALHQPRDPAAWLVWSGTMLYGCGAFAVTLAFNVPLNEALAAAAPTAQSAAAIWQDYAQPWITWNTLRMIASLLALFCFAAALWLEAGAAKSSH